MCGRVEQGDNVLEVDRLRSGRFVGAEHSVAILSIPGSPDTCTEVVSPRKRVRVPRPR